MRGSRPRSGATSRRNRCATGSTPPARDVAGLLGTDADGVAFVESASAAFDALLDAWPLSPGDRVGVAASEWGPNLETFAHRGLVPVTLPVDAAGVLDLEALEKQLVSDPPDLVHVDLVAAQRGLVQPGAEVVALAAHPRGPGLARCGAGRGARRGPSRCGRRLCDQPQVADRSARCGDAGGGTGAPAHAAAAPPRQAPRPAGRAAPRVRRGPRRRPGGSRRGACASTSPSVPERVHARLREVGRLVRDSVDAPRWLGGRPPGGARRFDDRPASRPRVRTWATSANGCSPSTACSPVSACRGGPRWRWAVHGPASPYLRLSPHVDLTEESVERVCQALTSV